MSLLTKECEVCGTKIRKLQSIWNIYLLKTGVNIKCPNCNLKLGAEVWIYTFIVLSLVEFIIMLVISLKRTVNNTRNN